MPIVIIAADITLIAVGLAAAINLVRSSRYLLADKRVLETRHGNVGTSRVKFVLMVPLLRESGVLDGLFGWLQRLEYSQGDLTIILVTTEREHEIKRGQDLDTVAGVKKRLSELKPRVRDRFIHVHYPYNYGVKSDQLNYALTQVSDDLPEVFTDKTYIGVFDADSCSQTDVLNLVHASIKRLNGPNILQLPSWYFKNYVDLPHSVTGYLAKAFAWIQTSFGLHYEARLLIKQGESRKVRRMAYCVGHGLFVRWPFLRQVGLFPTPIEDTRLGHVASYLGEPIHPVPVFDSAEVAVGVGRQIQQTSVWFTGEAKILADLKIARRVSPILISHAAKLFTYKLYRNGVWVSRPFVLYGFLLLSVLNGYAWLGVLAVLTVLYAPVLTLRFNLRRLGGLHCPNTRHGSLGDFLVVLLFIPVEFFIMSLGPALGLSRLMGHTLGITQLNLAKTEKTSHG